ncbi:tetratricopeptide repeat-containing sulfotransferase family protein [Arenibacterium halophilum]|uniref:Tetratricopeptide repeat protein n=1 Tax=Arenibacterium halophilum TaxID=2583821 RepID=A0ABY2XAN0_9RHOB|nr:tetratricopeptide repeat protein [Arenibacterium halophilum]
MEYLQSPPNRVCRTGATTTGRTSMQTDIDKVLALLREGSPKAAFKHARQIASRHPKHPVGHNLCGIAASAMTRYADSVEHFRKALKLAPDFHDARKNLAQSLLLLGRPELAIQQLDRLTTPLSGDGDLFYLLAQARLSGGDLTGASKAADRAIALQPERARNFNLRAVLRDRLGQQAAALDDYHEALRLNPADVETLINISLPLARQLRTDEARAALDRAVSLAPEHPGARLRLAAHLTETGDTQAAIAALHEVLRLTPDSADALDRLARLNDTEANRALLPRIEAAARRLPRTDSTRPLLQFALGHIAAQEGDPAAMARALGEANRAMARQMPHDAEAAERLDARIMDIPLEFGTASRHPGPRPIFVVGLPRSGTTLAEAILAAHPRVTALGERASAGILLYPKIEAGAPFDQAALEAIRSDYTAMLPDLSGTTEAYVDKMPDNYRLAGLLASAFPESRIIHIRRDPRDVALSMWRTSFTGAALAYTYDMSAMARRFNAYARLMAHWQAVIPATQLVSLSYEFITRDIAEASNSLADACGLNRAPEMAEPNRHAGQVLTASATQIRQPVHARSVGGWRHHTAMLQPLIDGLDPALWPELQSPID